MDFGALPPEINSDRMYSGPRSASMLAAADAWDRLADNLYDTAASCQSVVSSLTDEDWRGPASDSMADAIAPYLNWLTATADRAEQVARQARDAASAFETAFAATVPPPLIEANRAQLASLISGNFVSQDTPSITAVEADYSEMWAQDADAMYRYAGSSAVAATLAPLVSPNVDCPASAMADPADVQSGGADDALDMLTQVASALPRALRALAQPFQSGKAASILSGLFKLNAIPSPAAAFASALCAPLSVTPSGFSASKASGLPEVVAGWGGGVLVGRLSVPRTWGEVAFGSLRSIA